jgi:hypothetical protein
VEGIKSQISQMRNKMAIKISQTRNAKSRKNRHLCHFAKQYILFCQLVYVRILLKTDNEICPKKALFGGTQVGKYGVY